MANTHKQDPGYRFAEVTPSDTAELGNVRALYVGGAGNLEIVGQDGTAATFTGVLSGTTLPVQALKVMSTGTTATGIVAIY